MPIENFPNAADLLLKLADGTIKGVDLKVKAGNVNGLQDAITNNAQVQANKTAQEANATAITAIQGKFSASVSDSDPALAGSEVDQKIQLGQAALISASADGANFATPEALSSNTSFFKGGVPYTPKVNDVAFCHKAGEEGTWIYKCTAAPASEGATATWQEVQKLFSTSMTPSQQAALNSSATKAWKEGVDADITKAQADITANATSINGINGKIPDGASAENKLVTASDLAEVGGVSYRDGETGEIKTATLMVQFDTTASGN